MSDQPQSDLIQAVQRGDGQRFEALVAPYLPRLRREIYGVTRDAAAVDDLLQDTLLRAWRALPDYQDDGKFEAWLRTIARNVGLNEVRRRIARSIAQTSSIEEAEPPPTAATPEDDAAVSERLARLERMFDELPPEQKEVFVLHLLSGMSFKDIAAQQQVSINTALGRMHRVRQKVLRLLRGLWYAMPARSRPWVGVAATVAVLAAAVFWARGGPVPAEAVGAGPAPLAAATPPPPADPPPWYADFDFAAVGAIGYWPQDFDPYDATGTWPDGEWNGGQPVPGRFGDAWRFRPMMFYEVPLPPELTRLEEFTTAAWYLPDANHFEDTGHLIGIGQDGAGEPGSLAMRVATPGYAIVACTVKGENGDALHYYDPFPDWSDRWRHVACTYGRERGLQLHIDGVPVVPPEVNGDGSPNASRQTWQGAIEIGRARAPLRFNRSSWDNEYAQGDAARLSGILDELVLFDRALSAEEVAALAADADGNGRADFWDAALARRQERDLTPPRE